MKRPRVGVRAFLLITTLVSLVAAALAIRARTDSFRSAQDHDLLAHRLRVRLAWAEAHEQDASLIWERKVPPLVSQKWGAGCNLQVLSPVRSEVELPSEGRNLIVVSETYGVLRIRVFDDAGKRVVDIAEGYSGNVAHDQRVKDLKKQLVDLCPPHEIMGVEKAEVITAAISVVNSCRATLLANWRSAKARNKAWHAKAVAEAEHHERLAQSYRP